MARVNQPPCPIRVLSVDDNAPLCASLRTLFAQEEGIELVADAGDGRAGVELAATLRPDVVLLDIEMPVMNGIEAGEQIKRRLPDTRIIYFVAETTWRSQALALGADAFLLKDTPIDTLIRTIRGVVAAGPAAAQPSPTAARPGARGGRIARPQRLTERGGIRPVAAAAASRSGDERPPSQITPPQKTPSQTPAPPRAGRNPTLLRQIRSAAGALDRAAERLESMLPSPGRPTDRDQEAAANSGMAAARQAMVELLQAFAGGATGEDRGAPGAAASATPAQSGQADLWPPPLEPRPQAGPQPKPQPAASMEAPPSPIRAVPPVQTIHLAVHPPPALARLTQFMEAVATLQGVREVRPLRFQGGRLDVIVEYEGAEPLAAALRELREFRPVVLPRRGKVMRVSLGS